MKKQVNKKKKRQEKKKKQLKIKPSRKKQSDIVF